MKHLLPLLFFFYVPPSSASPADTIRHYYPNGVLRSIKILKQGKTVSEINYFDNGRHNHSWNIERKIVYSFNNFNNPADSSAVYFKRHCPTYTIYQHYGDDSTIFYEEHYKNNIRHGWARYYDRQGRLESEGEFNQWAKVGFWSYWNSQGEKDIHWHGIEHGFHERGLSIYHTVMPFCSAVLMMVGTGLYFIRRKAYATFFKLMLYFPYLLLFGWMIILVVLSESAALDFKVRYASSFITVLNTVWIAMVSICLANVIWAKRLQVKRWHNVVWLLTGLVVGFLVLMMQVLGSLAGAVL